MINIIVNDSEVGINGDGSDWILKIIFIAVKFILTHFANVNVIVFILSYNTKHYLLLYLCIRDY